MLRFAQLLLLRFAQHFFSSTELGPVPLMSSGKPQVSIKSQSWDTEWSTDRPSRLSGQHGQLGGQPGRPSWDRCPWCPRENPRSLSCLRAEILGGVPVGLVDLAVSLVDLAVGLVDRVGTGALDVLAKTPGLYLVPELRYWVKYLIEKKVTQWHNDIQLYINRLSDWVGCDMKTIQHVMYCWWLLLQRPT